jgi:hypothetical protein
VPVITYRETCSAGSGLQMCLLSPAAMTVIDVWRPYRRHNLLKSHLSHYRSLKIDYKTVQITVPQDMKIPIGEKLYCHTPRLYIRMWDQCHAPTALPPRRKPSSDWLRAGRSGDRIPVRGEFFRTRPDCSRGPDSLLYNGYRVSFPGVKRLGRGVDHPPYLAPRLKKE